MIRPILSVFAVSLTVCTVICTVAGASPSPHTLPPAAPKAQTSAPPPLSAAGTYGEIFDAAKAEPLDQAAPTLDAVKSSKGAPTPVVVKAKVGEVCPKKGCWMKVKGKNNDLRVTFKDYGFFVPVELVGREVALEGHYVVHRESIAEQKHLLEDARRPRSEIDAVTKERETLRFVATGVRDLSGEKSTAREP